MLDQVEAIYESGVLRPLQPLSLAEHEHVTVTVTRQIEGPLLDHEFVAECASEADAVVSLAEVRQALAKIRGSMDQAIDADRGEY
jgi:predicted DNA-binding antitoxin AbrB/MazE fold protein